MRIDVARESRGSGYDEKTYKKETREFMFDGGGNIDPVLGTVEEETRQRQGIAPGREGRSV